MEGDITRAPANNYRNNASNGLDQNYYTPSGTNNISDIDRVSVRFMHVKAPQNIPAVYPNDFADPRAGIRQNRHHNTTVNWIHNFSPTIINEFRFNWGDRLHINRSAAREFRQERRFRHRRRQPGIVCAHQRQRVDASRARQSRAAPDAYPHDRDQPESDLDPRFSPDQVRLQLALLPKYRRPEQPYRRPIRLRESRDGRRNGGVAAGPRDLGGYQ